MAASLELLTDDAILDYSRSDGKDRVLYSHKDLNLRFNGNFTAILKALEPSMERRPLYLW